MNLEDWDDSSEHGGSTKEDVIFELKKMESKSLFPRRGNGTSRIFTKMTSSNDIFLITTSDGSLLRWNGDPHFEGEEIEISRRSDDAIEHVFVDSTSTHSIVCLRSGSSYYIHSKSFRPKSLSKLTGSIESVCFLRSSSPEPLTRLLIGTKLGKVYEMVFDGTGREKSCQLVYQLEKQTPVTSIYSDFVTVDSPESKIFVLLATSSPFRLYYFVGSSNFQTLFFDYVQQGIIPYKDLEGEALPRSLIHYSKNAVFFTPSRQHNFSILARNGVVHGSIQLPQSLIR